MAFLFDMLAAAGPAFGDAAIAGSYQMGATTVPIISGAATGAASGAASGAVNSALSGAATAGTAALLTDKPDIKFPELKSPGKPTAPPGGPVSPADTAALQRAKYRPMAKSTILTRSKTRSSSPSGISRTTLSGGM